MFNETVDAHEIFKGIVMTPTFNRHFPAQS